MDRGAWWAYSSWDHKEADTTEQLHTHTHTHIFICTILHYIHIHVYMTMCIVLWYKMHFLLWIIVDF